MPVLKRENLLKKMLWDTHTLICSVLSMLTYTHMWQTCIQTLTCTISFPLSCTHITHMKRHSHAQYTATYMCTCGQTCIQTHHPAHITYTPHVHMHMLSPQHAHTYALSCLHACTSLSAHHHICTTHTDDVLGRSEQ
jgi:hypothetical protein